MNKDVLNRFLVMMKSPVDQDAIMGLRGLQSALTAQGKDLSKVITQGLDGAMPAPEKAKASDVGSTVKEISAEKAFDDAAEDKPEIKNAVPDKRAPIEASGMVQCVAEKGGRIQIIPSGQMKGDLVQLTGLAVEDVAEIATCLTDAIVAADLSKSRFKLKLQDIKDERGEATSAVLQAEYDDHGITQPVQIWSNVRGEVASLATILRRAVKATVPDYMA